MLKNFLDLCKKRRSIRKYLEKPVPRNLILKCIEASQLAPSAENKQPWRFIIIDDFEILSKFKKIAFSGIYSVTKWAFSAPVIIVVLAKLDFITHKLGALFQKTDFHYIDIGIACEHLVLQATELGLGSCYIGWFNYKNVRKFLKIPRSYKIVNLITLGFYDEKNYKFPNKKIRTIEQIVRFNESFK
jgi:nitroreductase